MASGSCWRFFRSILSTRLPFWRRITLRNTKGDATAPARSGTTEDLYRGERVVLFSWWGTVVYLDESTRELRHGLPEHHPANVVLVPCGPPGGENDAAIFACFVEGQVQLASCTTGHSNAVALAVGPLEAEPSIATQATFEFVTIDHDRIGLKAGGRFLCAEQDGRITLSRGSLNDWERFFVAIPPARHPLRATPLPLAISLAATASRTARDSGDLLVCPTGRIGARAVVLCNMDWLRTYIASEHFHLVRLLHEVHGFDIFNMSHADFDNRNLLRQLNAYDAILVTYAFGTPVPMNRLAGYRIYRIDDLDSLDPAVTQYMRRLAQNADMLIGAYAYDLPKFFPHPNIRWVPYSSAVVEEAGSPTLNDDPIRKVLISGSVAADRPFREYVFGLEDDRLVKLRHPGYGGRYDEHSPETVKRRWYEELRRYLCAFCDAHSLRYIHLRVFEIASVGSLLLADRLVEREMNELGYVEGRTCLFCDRTDFLDRVTWALDPANRAAVDRIRRAGMDMTLKRHTTGQRAAEVAALVDDAVLQGRKNG